LSNSINKVILVGNLGQEPQIKQLPSGTKLASLRIATSERWTDKTTNELRERTEWHSVTILQQATVQFVETYLRKGDQIYVEGRLRTRKWQDETGADRYSTEILVENYNGQIISLSKGTSSTQETKSSQDARSHINIDLGDIPF
jgi:single-strand DNA-binding protein